MTGKDHKHNKRSTGDVGMRGELSKKYREISVALSSDDEENAKIKGMKNMRVIYIWRTEQENV